MNRKEWEEVVDEQIGGRRGGSEGWTDEYVDSDSSSESV